MTREYLSDLEPEEVTERLNKGEEVFYTDSKGEHHSYKYINGICVRYTDGEVDGYGRSIYSTGECYFESKGTLHVKTKHHYRTRNGKTVYITDKKGIWCEGTMFLEDSSIDYSWTDEGEIYPGSNDPRDLVVELD